MTALKVQMQALAEATGQNVLIGKRGHKSDWFAHCDGVEWDGSTPEQALRAVAASILHRAEDAKRQAEKAAKDADAIRSALGVAPTDREGG